MAEFLDKKDKKILHQLDLNCRQPISSIAKQVRLSKDTVKDRIRRLEDAGIIQGYYAEINAHALGYKMYRIYIKFERTTPKDEEEMVSYLKKEGAVVIISSLNGSWDFVIITHHKNDYVFDKFWQEFYRNFSKFISKRLITPIITLYAYKKSYLYEEREYTETVMDGRTTVEIDGLDRRILLLLSNNARLSLIELAAKLGSSPKVIAYRMNKLIKKNVILSFRAQINVAKMGYEYYKIDVSVYDANKLDEMYLFAKRNPNTIYIDKTIGISDFEFDMEVKGFSEFTKIMDEIKAASNGNLENYEYFSVSKFHKLSFMPR